MKKIVSFSKFILFFTLTFILCGCSAKSNEENSNEVFIGNPWMDTDEKGIYEATGYNIKVPNDATDVHYSYCEEEKMAQVSYQMDSTYWTYRIKESSEAEDISGMYYEWNVSEEGTVSGKEATYMYYSDASEDSEYIDDVEYVQVVNWFDDVNKVSYSLSASGTDLNGMDIQVYAEQIYEPLQNEEIGSVNSTDNTTEYSTSEYSLS